MDILYILNSSSKENNEELKYSLRTVERFVKNVDRIFITGDCPNFIDKKKVVFTKCDDPYCRSLNHFYKVFNTFTTTDISDNCLLMYDDIFFTENVDINNYPWFYNGEISGKESGAYGVGLAKTRDWLENKGFSTNNFACHTPFVYNRLFFTGLFSIFNNLRDDVHGMSPRCIYGNQFAKNIEQIEEDVKVRTNRMSLDGVVHKTKCFSTGDFTFKVAKSWLYDNFKMKSRWEK